MVIGILKYSIRPKERKSKLNQLTKLPKLKLIARDNYIEIDDKTVVVDTRTLN